MTKHFGTNQLFSLLKYMINIACHFSYHTLYQPSFIYHPLISWPRAAGFDINGCPIARGKWNASSGKWKWFCDMFNSWRAKWLILNYSVLEVAANFT